jgi:molybdopterin converting factor small subunit
MRMRAALAAELGGGRAPAAVVVGSDVPDLVAPAIAAVLDAVSPAAATAADVAFAPSPDGGFYAVAARTAPAGMLGGEAGAAGVPWSTPDARVRAAAAAAAAGLVVAADDGGGLACLADIDTVEVRERLGRWEGRTRGEGADLGRDSCPPPTTPSAIQINKTQDLRAWRASAPADHPVLPTADAALAQAGEPSPSSLTVTARLFAAARDAAGGLGALTLALPPGASAADAVAALVAAHPRLRGVLGACAVAVNCEVVGPAVEGEGGDGGETGGTATAMLSPGDEVALIPPISGG